MSRYIVAALSYTQPLSTSVEIGGPEVMTYKELIYRYAAHKNKTIRTVTVPFVPKPAAVLLLRLLGKRAAYFATVADMIDSAEYTVTVQSLRARELFSDITPQPIESGF